MDSTEPAAAVAIALEQPATMQTSPSPVVENRSPGPEPHVASSVALGASSAEGLASLQREGPDVKEPDAKRTKASTSSQCTLPARQVPEHPWSADIDNMGTPFTSNDAVELRARIAQCQESLKALDSAVCMAFVASRQCFPLRQVLASVTAADDWTKD